MKRRGLGRGLEALLGARNLANEVRQSPQGPSLRMLDVSSIQPGRYQPRRFFSEEALRELADSIRVQGVIQPVVVRPLPQEEGHSAERFELIAGERRWRASQMAGLTQIPAVVRQMGEQTAFAVSLIENIQRQDLNAMEEAVALKRLIDAFSLTHKEVGEAVGRSRTSVANLVRLLDLVEEVQELLRMGHIEMGHARALLMLPSERQLEVAQAAIRQSLTVKATEILVRRLMDTDKTRRPREIDPNIGILQDELSNKLNAQVRVLHSAQGSGRLIIHYNSLDELDGIIQQMSNTRIDPDNDPLL